MSNTSSQPGTIQDYLNPLMVYLDDHDKCMYFKDL